MKIKNTMTPGLMTAYAAMLEAAQLGLVRSGLNLEHAIVHREPRPQLDTGHMRESVASFDSSGIVPGSAGIISAGTPPKLPAFTVQTAVTAPYSVYPHELGGLGPMSERAGGVGGKFVEAKLQQVASETGPITARTIREAGND